MKDQRYLVFEIERLRVQIVERDRLLARARELLNPFQMHHRGNLKCDVCQWLGEVSEVMHKEEGTYCDLLRGAREAFERWFCERHRLARFPVPGCKTQLESAAEAAWPVWLAGWDARRE